jgi:hypothetical protein
VSGRGSSITDSAEVLLRELYREHIGETLGLKKLAQKVEASIQSTHRQVLEPHPGGMTDAEQPVVGVQPFDA